MPIGALWKALNTETDVNKVLDKVDLEQHNGQPTHADRRKQAAKKRSKANSPLGRMRAQAARQEAKLKK